MARLTKVLTILLTFCFASFAFGQSKADPLEVRLGWQPLGGGSAAITMVMIRDKLVEKHAQKMGQPVKLTWRGFTAGPPMNEAMTAGLIDIDMHPGSLPTASRIGAGIPAVPIAMVGSNLANAVLVRPNSPIKDVGDLVGKTIGVPLGSGSHYLLASIIHAHFGKTIQEADIKLINMPVTEAAKVPNGVDAGAVWVPLRYIGPALGLSQVLIDATGQTGPAHKRPGMRVAEVQKAWAYPEGYMSDRLYAFAHERFLEKHPNLVLAFLMAFMEAQSTVLKDFDGTVALANSTWKQEGQIAKQTLGTYAETTGIRQSPFVTEADVLTILKASEFLASLNAVSKALTWEDVKALFMKSAAIQKRAWELSGSKPDLETMNKGFSGTSETFGAIRVSGGRPVWEWDNDDKWGKRIDLPGPFSKIKK